jgi:hypothetical protein
VTVGDFERNAEPRGGCEIVLNSGPLAFHSRRLEFKPFLDTKRTQQPVVVTSAGVEEHVVACLVCTLQTVTLMSEVSSYLSRAVVCGCCIVFRHDCRRLAKSAVECCCEVAVRPFL